MSLSSPLTVLPTAQNGGEGGAAGFDPFLLIMLAVFGLLIFMMFRRSRRAQQDQQTMRTSLAPGVEVMTSMGLFGTVVSVDQAQNKVVLEISPGNTATVHTQAIGRIVEPTDAPAADAGSTGAPAGGMPVSGESVPDSPAGLDARDAEPGSSRAEPGAEYGRPDYGTGEDGPRPPREDDRPGDERRP